MLKTNPQFLYEELKNINLSQIPPGFKNPNFRGDTDGGYLCEIRIKVNRTGRIRNQSQCFILPHFNFLFLHKLFYTSTYTTTM